MLPLQRLIPLLRLRILLPLLFLSNLFLLIEALLRLLEGSVLSAELCLDIKPFRIITTLLDKAEIGPLIIDQIMVDIWRALHHMSRLGPKSDRQLCDERRKHPTSNRRRNRTG